MPTLAEVAQYPDGTPIQFPVTGKIVNVYPPRDGEYGRNQGVKISDGSTLQNGRPAIIAITVNVTDYDPELPHFEKGQEITIQARFSEKKNQWVGAKKGTAKGEQGDYPKIVVYGSSLISFGGPAQQNATQTAAGQSKQSQGQVQMSIGPAVQISEDEAVAAFFRGFTKAAEKFGYMGGPDSWENMTPEEHGHCRAVGSEVLRGVVAGFIQPSKAAPATRQQSTPPAQQPPPSNDAPFPDDDDIPF